MEWYQLEESERIKEIYSKFTINDFWQWWSSGNIQLMEIITNKVVRLIL